MPEPHWKSCTDASCVDWRHCEEWERRGYPGAISLPLKSIIVEEDKIHA